MHTKVRFLNAFWQRNTAGSGPYLVKYTKKPVVTGDSNPGPLPAGTSTQYIFTRAVNTPLFKGTSGVSISKHEVKFDTDGAVNDFVISSTYTNVLVAPSNMG